MEGKMYCGIDVAKNKSSVCILGQDKEVKAEFEIEHTREGFEQLEKHLTKDTKIAMEITGIYCKTLYEYLKERYNVSYIDNIQMHNFAKLHFYYVKNDKVDAKLIALYLLSGHKTVEIVKFDELKDLSKVYQSTIKQLTRYKLMFKSQLNVIFPELEKEFSIQSFRAIASLLSKHPTPEKIAELEAGEINKFLANKAKSEKIKRLAGESIGIKDTPLFSFKNNIKIIIFYQSLIDKLKAEMSANLAKTPYCKLLDEFGYNVISLATIVGEIGDIRRFSNYKKLVKYCGLDVSEKQSGRAKSVNCFITKRGNKTLRFTFYNLVLTHLRNENNISNFYYRLKEAGKHPKQCHMAAARKLVVKCWFDMMRCHYHSSL